MTCDVLMLIGNTGSEKFLHMRGTPCVLTLNEAGIPCRAVMYDDMDEIVELIDTLNPKLVYIRSMVLTAGETRHLARKYPDITFISVNHSSQGDLGRSPLSMGRQADILKLTQELDNVWFGDADETTVWGELGYERAIWMPFPVRSIEVGLTSYVRTHTTISLISQPRDLKNIPNQILALGLLEKRRPGEFMALVSDDLKPCYFGMLDVAGVNYSKVPFMPWEEYMAFLKNRVDIGLQCSFTESFNFVSIEHMLLGIPVVGSSAIRHIHPDLKVDPNDPHQICALLERAAKYKWATCVRESALKVQSHCNRAFVEVIDRLFNRATAMVSLSQDVQ